MRVSTLPALLRLAWQMHRNLPSFLSFNVTNRCNEACPMCGVRQIEAEELSLAEIGRILADLKRFGFLVVEVSGGEPFLRPDIFEIYALLDRLGFLYTTTSNGTVLDREQIGRLARVGGMLQLAISIDSLDRETYRSLRGRDLLPAVLETLELLAAAPPPQPVKLNMALSRRNYREALDILGYARERGFYLSVFPVSFGTGFSHRAAPTGEADSPPVREEMAALFRQLARLRRAGEPLWEYSGFYELAAEYLLGKAMGPCRAGELFADLHADGQLAACIDQPAFADLRRESMATVWPRIAVERENIRACFEQTPCCYTCTYNVALTARHQLEFLIEAGRVRRFRRARQRP